MPLSFQQLTESQIEAAKGVITEVCFEFFGRSPVHFEDMDEISIHYTAPYGTFLVLMDDERVVGTGAIRRIDNQTCELKRLWFLPAYRGRGYGTKMAELLFEFGRSIGCHKVILDTSPALQAANRLYRRLGFVITKQQDNGPCTIFMEKSLHSH